MYANKSLKYYLNDLAARKPAPGGGSAAAFTASLAAALVSMVINYTIGNPKYKKYEQELKLVLDKSEKLRAEFLKLTDLDVAAYKSKDARNCLNVPFMAARLCFEAVKLCQPLIKKTNTNLISDLAIAVILFESSFSSSWFNVEINLKSLTDNKFTVNVRKELSQKQIRIKKIRRQMEAKIGRIIRG
ncbi:MAG: cyclodeaminase/cyclohydrolase family protein [Candidatus Omnitrophota bacterium]